MTATVTERHDVVVIGGGQAGLAASHHLTRRGIEHVVLDAGARVGDAWRDRWDSLRLFTPAGIDGLPGMPFPLLRDGLADEGPDGRLPPRVRHAQPGADRA